MSLCEFLVAIVLIWGSGYLCVRGLLAALKLPEEE